MFPTKGDTVCLLRQKDLLSDSMKRALLVAVQQMVRDGEARRILELEYDDETGSGTFTAVITGDYLPIQYESLSKAWLFQARVESSMGRGNVAIYVDPDRIETADIEKLVKMPLKPAEETPA